MIGFKSKSRKMDGLIAIHLDNLENLSVKKLKQQPLDATVEFETYLGLNLKASPTGFQKNTYPNGLMVWERVYGNLYGAKVWLTDQELYDYMTVGFLTYWEIFAPDPQVVADREAWEKSQS